MNRHRGGLAVESVLGEGATFTAISPWPATTRTPPRTERGGPSSKPAGAEIARGEPRSLSAFFRSRTRALGELAGGDPGGGWGPASL